MAEEDNGHALSGAHGGKQRVTITLEPGTMKLGCDLDTLNLEMALSMLDRATRELDARWRFQRAQELQADTLANRAFAEAARNPTKFTVK